ncbi:hypothetical protein ACSHT2_07255 [Bradyrhizobium sp. PUT101]|uniref:hypothetical protein n=1 Tax=Bradyrhizobium sp. PUT101 TaxID=3447427 RepID=UPI003F8489EC
MSPLDRLPPDLPISLKAACEIMFAGAITPATLKAEHGRGNLELFKIGRAHFTTRRQIEAMIEKCRQAPPHRKTHPEGNSDERTRAAHAHAALVALRLTLNRVKAPKD